MNKPLVLDADLAAQLEQARGQPGFSMVQTLVQSQQAMRNKRAAEAAAQAAEAAAKQAALDALPPGQRRRQIAREGLQADKPTQEDLRHIHSVLAVCGLPYRQTSATRFERSQGGMSLLVNAGELMTPGGAWQPQPLPYGPKARLILMHLCSEAVQQKRATVEIADSFTAFVRDMGFEDSGGPRGVLTAFKKQLNALAACRMTLGTFNGSTARTKALPIIDDFELWLSNNPAQKSLWPSTVTFSAPMFESLQRHAVPINAQAVRAFRNSARMLDLYFWTGYRLHNISKANKPLHIGWKSLGEQFGEGFARERAFKAQLAEEIGHLTEVFPKLPVRLTEEGLILDPAGPEVLQLPPRPLPKKSPAKLR